MPRTDSASVTGVLLKDYDAKNAPSLTPFIAIANSIVNRVVVCATNKGYTLSDADLTLMETLLAAHEYCMSDKPYASRSTQGASGAFQGQTGQGFEQTNYGQNALRLDYSNCLRNIDKQQRAGGAWLGKPKSEQIPYCERN